MAPKTTGSQYTDKLSAMDHAAHASNYLHKAEREFKDAALYYNGAARAPQTLPTDRARFEGFRDECETAAEAIRDIIESTEGE